MWRCGSEAGGCSRCNLHFIPMLIKKKRRREFCDFNVMNLVKNYLIAVINSLGNSHVIVFFFVFFSHFTTLSCAAHERINECKVGGVAATFRRAKIGNRTEPDY
jgi:hypothetical protein